MTRRSKAKSAGPAIIVLLFGLMACPMARAELTGGCAKVNITPPVGIPLIGSYGKPSESVLDDLYVRALVLDDGHTTLAIVSADLLYAPLEEIAGPVRGLIGEKSGIPEQNVLVCGTHTHSGPEVFTRSKVRVDQTKPVSELDQAYLQTLIRKMASSAIMAHQNMKAVKIGVARGLLPEVVFNRRTITSDGSAVMTFSISEEVASTRRIETDREGQTLVSFVVDANKPELKFGPVDPELWVLRVEDANENIVGSVVNFACHPVCVYPYLPTAISADFPGDVTALVEQVEGGTCLFTLGTAGDMVPYQRGERAHRQMGKAIGSEALRRLQFAGTSDDVTLEARTRKIRFPVKQPDAGGAAEETGKVKEPIETEMQVLRLGDIYILGLPGEILAEVGLEIKKRAGIEKLVIVSLANDAIGYVCHSQAYDEGGYEPGRGSRLAKGAGEIMVAEALDLIDDIKSGD